MSATITEYLARKNAQAVAKAEYEHKLRLADQTASRAYVTNRIVKAKLPAYLFIPDLHIPFEHRYALEFCKELQREHNIDDANVYQLGDFTDDYFANAHEISPDAEKTPNDEIDEARARIKEWVAAFPLLNQIVGNHNTRAIRRAAEVALPSQVLKSFRELLELPESWKVEEQFLLFAEHSPALLIHGEGFRDAGEAALYNAVNLIMGHLHSKANVRWIKTANQEIYGVDSGCLIDQQAYVYKYSKHGKLKSLIGATVGLNGLEYCQWRPL